MTRLKWIIILLSLAAALGLAASGSWWKKLRSAEPRPEGLIEVSGRIEGREITVAPKIQGRIKALLAEEGDCVKQGQLLAEIVSEQLDARVASLQESTALLATQTMRTTADLELTEKNTAASINAAEATVNAVSAQLEKARAAQAHATKNYERFAALHEKGDVSSMEFERRRLEFEATRADVKAAEKELSRAAANLELARAAQDMVKIKRLAVEEARKNHQASLARVREVEADQRETKLFAPSAGTILARPVEPGEIVNPGAPLFVLVDTHRLYLKVYIPETEIGRLKLGNEARIYVDAFPGQSFPARITKVNQQAEFTPKNVETKEERVKLVFGVELSVDNPEGRLKPGMPADAQIRWKDDAPWKELK